MLKFNAIAGLNVIVPGAKFRGEFINHTEEEYNNIE